MVADVVRRLAVRDLPGDVPGVHVDGRDAAPGRLDHRESVDARRRLAEAYAVGPPADEVHVRPFRVVDEAEGADLGLGVDVEEAGLGVGRRAGPVDAPRRVGELQGAEHVRPGHRRRVVEPADGVPVVDLHGADEELGRVVDEVADAQVDVVDRGRPRRNRLGRRVPLARHVPRAHGDLGDRPHRLAGLAVEHEHVSLLGGLDQGLDLPPVDGDVQQDGPRRQVPVPDVVVHRLVVPHPLAGVEVDGDDAARVQVVAGPVAAVIVAGGRLHGEVGHVQLGVDGPLRPHPGVAGVAPRVVQPGVVAELVAAGDGVEDPLALAGAGVEPAHVALDVGPRGRRPARPVGGPDEDRVAGHDGRGVQPDLGRRLEVLVDVLLQVHDAVVPEALLLVPGAGVEGHELVAGGHVEHHPVAAVVPVREPAARQPARRGFAALALVDPVHPQQFAGRRVEGDDRAARPRGDVQDAVDHQRRRLVGVLGLRPEVVGVEPPRQLHLAEVPGGDLVEGGVAVVRQVAAVRRPFAVGRRQLLGRRRDGQQRGRRGGRERHGSRAH